ncbi:unnamed protein product [Cylicostephanus goldi]|uniref:UBX domain-containing protein 4 n=1 Tax=Cylicostephanus goldi TaxID=71465 RepID=A0A3P7PXV5_CYLGO|nr:unnamed protein product [Cylicostephanus goldi]
MPFERIFLQTFTAGKKGGSSGQGTSRSSGDLQQADQPSTSKQSSSSNVSAHSLSLEEKVERAKRLLEEKKKAEEEAAKLREKERELERINEGKLAQEAQKKREEQAIIDAAAQRRRDKIEAEKERQRLIAQIKADREEREYRERLARHADTASAGDMPAQPPPPPKMEPIPSDRCRVQVRLPEGDNIVEEFSSSDCLNTLMELIRQDGRVRGAFSLAQVYPRKVFTEEELQKSYLELCLTPSCTLLVIQKHPKTSNIIAASPLGGVYSLISMLLIAPLQYIYGIVAGWFGWNSGSGSSSSSNQAHQEPKRQREPHEPHGATVRRVSCF